MTPTTLHERLLFAEARLAMIEDRLDYLISQARLVIKSLVGWAELGTIYLAIRLFLRYAPELKGKR